MEMKTKKDFIEEIIPNASNFKYCADNNKINGTLYMDIVRVMEEYKDQFTLLPNGYKIYECTDCKVLNIKRDNGEIRVGFCDVCEHPLWN